jgi:hypothetical protein
LCTDKCTHTFFWTKSALTVPFLGSHNVVQLPDLLHVCAYAGIVRSKLDFAKTEISLKCCTYYIILYKYFNWIYWMVKINLRNISSSFFCIFPSHKFNIWFIDYIPSKLSYKVIHISQAQTYRSRKKSQCLFNCQSICGLDDPACFLYTLNVNAPSFVNGQRERNACIWARGYNSTE